MDQSIIRNQLLILLEGSNSHISFDKAVENFPIGHINTRVPGVPYSSWELVEHMRFAQFDIIDFIKNTNYKESAWPEDYWPKQGKTATENDWIKTIKSFMNDRETLKEIIRAPETDLTAPLGHAPNYNIFREIILMGNHNSYHTGQIIIIRRALDIF